MKAKKKIMLALLSLSVASGVGVSPTLMVDAALSPELIIHGDYGGGASSHGTDHYLKYDAEKNEYYVTRNSTGIMNRISGTAFETKDMKDSQQQLDNVVTNRETLVKDEASARSDEDAKIQEKIDTSGVLTYDDNSHGSISLKGEGGTTLSNVKTDADDATSLANGDYLSKLDALISQEETDRETALSAETTAREKADQELSDRLGTIPANQPTNFVDDELSASDNLLALDSEMKKNSDALSDNVQHRKDLMKEESQKQLSGDEELWSKLGDLDAKGNYITPAESASSNLEILDTKIGEISSNTSDFNKRRNEAVSNEKKARENADKLISDKIGTISADTKVNYIHKDATVTDNLKELDSAIANNNEALAKESQEREKAIDELLNGSDEKLDSMQKEVTETGAKVAAIANLKYGDYTKGQKTSVSVGFGNYRSKTAGAIGVKHYFNRDMTANAAVTTGAKKMANFGVATRIRMDTPELKELQEIKKEMSEIADDNEKLSKEVDILKAVQGGIR